MYPGWTAKVSREGVVVLTDTSGEVRARWSHSPNSDAQIAQASRFHRTGRYEVEVPGIGSAVVDNGRSKPRRRHHFDGFIELVGRRYEVVHLSRRRTELRRDASLVARFRSGRGGRAHLLEDRARDETDRLVMGLVLAAVGVGRPGWLEMQLEGL
ncbi:hypothetical protein N864_12910 [Intrasporangium chromatireducens Q5-1]|uniref:Uncharacterized protein n=1 Tax=Intrasporangium chromatireducens Q5-1 TaxID=584657 RepID=W9GPV1_9MICO|nr:hypothetical protein N864_12910 [Intrasporangium chromatireducens Q5-1]